MAVAAFAANAVWAIPAFAQDVPAPVAQQDNYGAQQAPPANQPDISAAGPDTMDDSGLDDRTVMADGLDPDGMITPGVDDGGLDAAASPVSDTPARPRPNP